MYSELFSRVFNKGNLRIVGALAIPVAFILFWFHAQREASMEVKEFKEAQRVHPNTDQTVVKNYELKEVDDSNQLRWLLAANQGVMEPVSRDVSLKEVHVDYYDGKTLKMRLKAPVGQANELTRKVELNCADGKKVVAEGEGGKAKLEAAKVELTKKNQFQATGGVNIVWPGVAKVSGNKAEGSLASTDLKNLTIMGNTHALIGLRE